MLYLTLPELETGEPEIELTLEHSLVSVSNWEMIHEKVFFGREERTEDEMASYVEAMVIGSRPPSNFISRLSAQQILEINAYIGAKKTATWFQEESAKQGRGSSDVVTSELVYYWMIGFNIPFKPCDEWHFARLMTLIRICGVKQAKPKPMSRAARAEQMRSLNAQRRASLGTSG